MRTVRHDGQSSEAKTHLLTDLLRVDDQRLIKPFLLGLPNRHNVLFDLEQGRLAGWWTGDTASQYTEGKSWFWEVGGVNLLQTSGGDSTFALIGDKSKEVLQPTRIGQFVTSVDRWRHIPGGLSLAYRLHFDADGSQESFAVHIAEQITAIGDEATDAEGKGSGWQRTISVGALPDGFICVF
ncbi:MAG: hypothetical protein R3C05_11735 [Pirellulaceae bacterium]